MIYFVLLHAHCFALHSPGSDRSPVALVTSLVTGDFVSSTPERSHDQLSATPMHGWRIHSDVQRVRVSARVHAVAVSGTVKKKCELGITNYEWVCDLGCRAFLYRGDLHSHFLDALKGNLWRSIPPEKFQCFSTDTSAEFRKCSVTTGKIQEADFICQSCVRCTERMVSIVPWKGWSIPHRSARLFTSGRLQSSIAVPLKIPVFHIDVPFPWL